LTHRTRRGWTAGAFLLGVLLMVVLVARLDRDRGSAGWIAAPVQPAPHDARAELTRPAPLAPVPRGLGEPDVARAPAERATIAAPSTKWHTRRIGTRGGVLVGGDHRLAGVVLGPDGAPVEDAWVHARRTAGLRSFSVQSDLPAPGARTGHPESRARRSRARRAA
jgi:hypothetical protein